MKYFKLLPIFVLLLITSKTFPGVEISLSYGRFLFQVPEVMQKVPVITDCERLSYQCDPDNSNNAEFLTLRLKYIEAGIGYHFFFGNGKVPNLKMYKKHLLGYSLSIVGIKAGGVIRYNEGLGSESYIYNGIGEYFGFFLWDYCVRNTIYYSYNFFKNRIIELGNEISIYSGINMESGWDRYNEPLNYKHAKLRMLSVNQYIRYHFLKISGDIGIIDPYKNPSFSFGGRVGLHFAPHMLEFY